VVAAGPSWSGGAGVAAVGPTVTLAITIGPLALGVGLIPPTTHPVSFRPGSGGTIPPRRFTARPDGRCAAIRLTATTTLPDLLRQGARSVPESPIVGPVIRLKTEVKRVRTVTRDEALDLAEQRAPALVVRVTIRPEHPREDSQNVLKGAVGQRGELLRLLGLPLALPLAVPPTTGRRARSLAVPRPGQVLEAGGIHPVLPVSSTRPPHHSCPFRGRILPSSLVGKLTAPAASTVVVVVASQVRQ